MKTIGQIAYEAFCEAGRRIPEPWELKDRFEREMWERAAKSVAERCAKACEDLDLYDEYDPGSSYAEAVRKLAEEAKEQEQKD